MKSIMLTRTMRREIYARARGRPCASTDTGPIFCRSQAANAAGSKRTEFPILKQGMRPSAASLYTWRSLTFNSEATSGTVSAVALCWSESARSIRTARAGGENRHRISRNAHNAEHSIHSLP